MYFFFSGTTILTLKSIYPALEFVTCFLPVTLIVYFCQFFFFFLTCFSTAVPVVFFLLLLFCIFFFLMLTALLSSALLFVFYGIVEAFSFRVTAWLEDPNPVTSQHPSCLFEYFTLCVLLIIDVSNKTKMNRSSICNHSSFSHRMTSHANY